MYESFFGFREKPFSLLPDPSFLFRSKIHQEALVLVEYGLHNQAGFTILTGEIGSGKTTLMRHLLETVDSDFTVGLISNTHESLGQLMDWVCAAFELPTPVGNKLEQHHAFVDFLINQYAQGQRTLLIIDEAQNLSVERLEELRLLSNINADKDFVLQLLLLGQPQLREQLRLPALEQFIQRVSASYHLGRMSSEDTFNYIRHRLKTAGGKKDIFGPDACHAVFHYSKGIPRVINLICDSALVHSYAAGAKKVSGAIIDELVKSQASHLLVAFEAEERQPLTESEEVAIAHALQEATETEERDEEHSEPEKPAAGLQSQKTAGGVVTHEAEQSGDPDWPLLAEEEIRPPPREASGELDTWRQRISSLTGSKGEGSFRWETPLAIGGAVLVSLWITSWFAQEERPETPPPPVEPRPAPQVGSAQGSQPIAQSAVNSAQPNIAVDLPGAQGPSGSNDSGETQTTPAAIDRTVPQVSADLRPREPGSLSGSDDQASRAESTTPGRSSPETGRTSLDDQAQEAAKTEQHAATTDAPSNWTDGLINALEKLPVSVERSTDGQSLLVDLGQSVQFRPGYRNLDPAAVATLAQVAELLKRQETTEVTVIGHTDAKGSSAANQLLSERRAQSVEQFLVEEGVSPDRLSYRGKGETEPKVDETQDPVNGAKINRRIELRLTQSSVR